MALPDRSPYTLLRTAPASGASDTAKHMEFAC
jgi:hypothetical protein